MEQESENLKMGEHLAILSRAVKMLFSLSRGYILCTILKSFLGAAVLYVPIYFLLCRTKNTAYNGQNNPRHYSKL